MSSNNLYWQTEIESLSPAQLRDLEAPLIAQQIAYVYEHSSYYRNLYDEAGIKPAQVFDHDSLALLPFIEKSDLVAYQRQGELFGPHQCAPTDDIVRMVATGGSSGTPTRLGWTKNDIQTYNDMGARGLWTLGCRPNDLVINCFNYRLYSGGIMDHMSFENLGATILPYGVGSSAALLELLTHLPESAVGGQYTLYSTPSYAVRLADLAEEKGIDLHSLPIRKGIFSGEPGLQVPGYRERIESAWGMQARDYYGTAELGVQSGECEHHQGFHYSSGGLVVAELIDPDTCQVIPIEDGVKGELVFTSLQRQACPMIRLRTHDTVQVFTEPCACGRHSFRFNVLGRSDDMFIVKGVNVFPLSVQEALLSLRPQVTGEFFIELEHTPPSDVPPKVMVEVNSDLAVAAYQQVTEQVVKTIQQHANFTAQVVLVAAGDIASEHKTKRLYRTYEGDQAPLLSELFQGA